MTDATDAVDECPECGSDVIDGDAANVEQQCISLYCDWQVTA